MFWAAADGLVGPFDASVGIDDGTASDAIAAVHAHGSGPVVFDGVEDCDFITDDDHMSSNNGAVAIPQRTQSVPSINFDRSDPATERKIAASKTGFAPLQGMKH